MSENSHDNGKNQRFEDVSPIKLNMVMFHCHLRFWGVVLLPHFRVKIRKSKKSPTGPTERTPKPEYLIALATYLGARW